MSQFDITRRTLVAGAAATAAWTSKGHAAAKQGEVRDHQDDHPDVFVPAQTTRLAGANSVLDTRMQVSVAERLCKLNLDDILEPYVHRPGAQEWAGEHVGKFLHAGTLALGYAPNQKLSSRVDEAARKLVRTQLADGYLGTYSPKKHWTS